MDFSAAELIAILKSMHELEADQGTALEARLKHLKRLGFPAATGPGRGGRVGHGIEDVLKLLLVFQLLEAGMPSVRAADLVGRDWPGLRKILAGGLRHVRNGTSRPPLIMIEPHALASLGRLGLQQQSEAERLEIGSQSLRAERAVGPAVRIVVDPSQVMRRLLDVLRASK